MFKNLVTFALLAVSVVNATPVCVITAPVIGTVWTAGTPASIAWSSPTVATFNQITLMTGPASALQTVGILFDNVPSGPGYLNFTVPATYQTSTDCVLQIGLPPTAQYIGPFTILNQGGVVGTPIASTVQAAASTASVMTGMTSMTASGSISTAAPSTTAASKNAAGRTVSAAAVLAFVPIMLAVLSL
ncbi:hypothetical protein BC937DRAFT_86756 [Endogone sp. FLAS-F59071]|nr:hypothetical protein BC937DRAFT_86756 [Endogone sp. FLAS-F59071]|eukprot:RUS22799.1 hypothetical protein BC937DRAFT_86756 [Endogone sp. FLAS-F59071]